MPKYRIEQLSFIDNVLVQAGTEIDTDAPPASHWTPLDKKAEKASAEAEAAEAERIQKLQAQQAAAQAAIDTLAAAGVDPSAGLT